MHNWFSCKVSFEKMLENGMQKKVIEEYLVDSLSFTEAEAKIIEEIRPFITGEFTVTDIKRAKISELFFNENGDRFYKFKVYFITLDEKSGSEKKTAATMLSQASTLKAAIEVLETGMKGTMADYTIASVTETQIMDVFVFNSEVARRAESIEEAEIVKALGSDSKSIKEQMTEARDIVVSKPKKEDGNLITRTQAYIREKARHDADRYEAATVEMALAQRSPGLRLWFLGCGQLLIEGLEI